MRIVMCDYRMYMPGLLLYYFVLMCAHVVDYRCDRYFWESSTFCKEEGEFSDLDVSFVSSW